MLTAVAHAFRASLPPGGLTTFRIDALDRVGVPVVQANLLLPGEPAIVAYGYGFSELEASVGALGELCEEVHVGRHVAEAAGETASTQALIARLGAAQVADPLALCLPAGCGYTPAMPLDWIAATRWPDGGRVMVPREWVAAYDTQLPRPPALITPITNGLGAGFDLEHAVAHGLMELLQRDGNATSFRALDQGVVVTPDCADAETAALLDRLRGLGIAVTVKLAGDACGIPDLYVVGDDHGPASAPIQITACGEACHPDTQRALRKAVLEFVGSRSRKVATHGPIDAVLRVMPADYARAQMDIALLGEESRAIEAMAEWVGRDAATLRARLAGSVFAERRRVALSSLPSATAAEMAHAPDRLAWLFARLQAEGLPLLYVDCSPPDRAVRVVKVIVPGLECETMSYGRIGWRGVARLRARGELILDRPQHGAARVLLRPQDEERAGGPAWFDRAEAERRLGALYPLYRECGPFAAQIRARDLRG